MSCVVTNVMKKYISFLNEICQRYNLTKDYFYNFEIFGSYGKTSKLIMEDPKDIFDYSQVINVTENESNINTYYSINKTIVLRPYNEETILILGCGNLHNFSSIFKNNAFWCAYEKNHHHHNAYTINPDLAMNPSICAEFGKHIFSSIPSGSFELIIFESFMPEIDDSKYYPFFVSELSRLIKDDGKICFSQGNTFNNKLICNVILTKHNENLYYGDVTSNQIITSTPETKSTINFLKLCKKKYYEQCSVKKILYDFK